MRYLPLLLALAWGCAPADQDADGYIAGDGPRQDCDDNDLRVNPAAEEVPYDGKDNDCNSDTPDDDLDGDGFAANGDCDDEDPDSYPGAAEACDGIDNDCDDVIDNNAGPVRYADADGDGFGDPADFANFCQPVDGYSDEAGDCDDDDADVNPDAVEVCNETDDDCNGIVDDDADDARILYADSDGDGFGVSQPTLATCNLGNVPNWSENDDDCNDGSQSIAPGKVERCDGIDNDCNDKIDDGAGAPGSWYLDYDGDGKGDSSTEVEACDAPTSLYVDEGGDADDTDPSVQ